MNVGIAVHRFDRTEGTGGYAVELVQRLVAEHRITVYTARVAAPVPAAVDVVHVPALLATAYTAVLSFPPALRLVRRRHDLFHAQGWVSGRADIVTAHIVLGAWREAAAAAGVSSRPGERLLGGFVEARERNLFRRARAVIAPSHMAADDIAAHYGRREGVHVVHHGFPRADPGGRAEARQALGLPADAFLALFAGDPRKGLDATLAGVAAAPGVHLAVAGHGRPAGIRARAAAAGLQDRVTVLGPLPDLTGAYAAADVLVHPTIYDTFGLVVAEAMAHGVVPVVTRRAGIAELLAHGQSGWIVEGERGAGVAAALAALAGDAELRGRMAAEARRVARTRTWDDVARETLAVYRAVVP